MILGVLCHTGEAHSPTHTHTSPCPGSCLHPTCAWLTQALPTASYRPNPRSRMRKRRNRVPANHRAVRAPGLILAHHSLTRRYQSAIMHLYGEKETAFAITEFNFSS